MPRFAAPLALAALLLPASAAQAAPPASFYKPPSPLPGSKHGDVIRSRSLTGSIALKGAKANKLVLYRSVGLANKNVAVSGLVALPKGKAPKSGWPVITWAHGTTGMADQCAPTIAGQGDPAMLNTWVKKGYAVVATDYEGLGTPGVHPYLNGNSEGHSILDIVRAARKLYPALGKRVVISGHSQGGQAALWAASLAPKYTPELKVRGTVAFAPASHLSEQVPLVRALTQPSGLTGLAAEIGRGVDLADPAINVVSLLSDKAAALYPSVDTSCLSDLDKPDSYGGMAPAELFRDGADLGPLTAALNSLDDPENLTIKTPVRIEQGTADTTVLPPFTDQLYSEYSKRGNPVVLRKYDGVDHSGIVVNSASIADATAYIKSRFK